MLEDISKASELGWVNKTSIVDKVIEPAEKINYFVMERFFSLTEAL